MITKIQKSWQTLFELSVHMLIQGDSTGDKPLVEHVRDYIRDKYNKPGKVFCGVIHRLDRPVSGVVVFARAVSGGAAIFHHRRDVFHFPTALRIIYCKEHCSPSK